MTDQGRPRRLIVSGWRGELAAGGRRLSDNQTAYVILTLDQWMTEHILRHGRQAPVTVVHGAGTGVDQVADTWATGRTGVTIERHPADWQRYGNRAGPLRNKHMASLGASMLLAFPAPGSKGTWRMIEYASDAMIMVRLHPLPRD